MIVTCFSETLPPRMASIFCPIIVLDALSKPYLMIVMVELRLLFFAAFRGRPLRFGAADVAKSAFFGGLDTSLPVFVTLICFFGVVSVTVFSVAMGDTFSLPSRIVCSPTFGGVTDRD